MSGHKFRGGFAELWRTDDNFPYNIPWFTNRSDKAKNGPSTLQGTIKELIVYT